MTGMLAYLSGPRRNAALLLAVLVIGVAAGLIVGGALRAVDGVDGNAASAAAASSSRSTPTAVSSQPPLLGSASPGQGRVVADPAAQEMTTEISLGRTRTHDGAVAAFTAYAAWLIGSPAAASDPQGAVDVVGGDLINSGDAHQLRSMQRSSSDAFDAEHGAYRVIGHAGAAAPSEVMIEVVAPLTMGGKTKWRTIGGVVGWTPQGWQLVSIQPRDVVQPSAKRTDVRNFSAKERTRTLDGLGWRAFRLTSAR